MIIVEASHIYFGGGYTLLLQVLDNFEKNNITSVVYISNIKVFHELKKRNYEYVKILFSSTFKTLLRYLKRRKNVIFFCNLPPFVRNRYSITYFHNVYFLKRPKLTFKNSKIIIYYFWLKLFSNNTDYLVCQTYDVQKSLLRIGKNVKVLPFFDSFNTRKMRKERRNNKDKAEKKPKSQI